MPRKRPYKPRRSRDPIDAAVDDYHNARKLYRYQKWSCSGEWKRVRADKKISGEQLLTIANRLEQYIKEAQTGMLMAKISLVKECAKFDNTMLDEPATN